jgi:peptidoglycan/xylan/chitin deacetylase (PgdA/CDA1 family)
LATYNIEKIGELFWKMLDKNMILDSKQKIIFTVDVEGHVGENPVSRLIYGAVDEKEYGIAALMDMLDHYKIKGLFFVDIAEAWDYGEEKISGVLKFIKNRGHDVGVHIHPDHMADKKRLFLSEYSYDEQYKMIKQCTDFYKKVLGEQPIAFRAGKYGANWITLEILAKLGYKVDFSQFYGQKWCHINPCCTKTNTIQLDTGLIEVPVSTYKSFDKTFYSRYDKIDAELMFMEFQSVITKMKNSNSYNIIVMFAHSFSLLNWRRKPNTPSYDKAKHNKLKKQLEYVSQNSYTFISLEDVVNMEKIDSSEINELEACKGPLTWLYLISRIYLVLKAKIDIKFRKN